ncbi:DUF6624 domain-containing protein [Streptomyces sp. E1N211]|uniref:DUF6624 domain-containing protein n=1 Tax=Streptomyces sp. E1N211 TaxID=1851876 RepID=UPI000EF68A5F|nr:DUF6624 domain-containing protein [Streptomyces sp. E1N211]
MPSHLSRRNVLLAGAAAGSALALSAAPAHAHRRPHRPFGRHGSPSARVTATTLYVHPRGAGDFTGAAILLERAVKSGDALIQHWAHLHDRALINNRHQQEYGTQLLLQADGIELCPLRAPESVDERRAGVGLPPIAVALESVRRRYTSDRHAEEAPAVALARAA